VIYGARPKSIDLWSNLGEQVNLGPVSIPRLNLVTIGVTLALMAALTLFLRATSLGVQMRAAAEDFKMARYLGVRANFVIGLAFAISGILAAAASLLFVSQTGALSQTMGQPIALLGAVVGGFAIGLIVVMLQAYLPPDLRVFRDAFAFGFVILVLVARPSGLIRARGVIERV
jgi:branched-chain amino acid transport system permease protein